MVLRERPWPTLARLGVAVAFALVGALTATATIGAPSTGLRVAAGVISVGAVIAAITYGVLLLRPQQLLVHDDRLEVRGVRGAARTVPLADVAVFARPTGVHSRLVGYRLNGAGRRAQDAGEAHTQQATVRDRHGVDVLLPSTQAYGRAPDELVDELNARLASARRRHGPPG